MSYTSGLEGFPGLVDISFDVTRQRSRSAFTSRSFDQRVFKLTDCDCLLTTTEVAVTFKTYLRSKKAKNYICCLIITFQIQRYWSNLLKLPKKRPRKNPTNFPSCSLISGSLRLWPLFGSVGAEATPFMTWEWPYFDFVSINYFLF
jgi:hypothetical protein